MTDFYTTLPSDSSMKYFPDNTVAHFKTKLADHICFDGSYEVALTEIVYPQNYFNFTSRAPMSADIYYDGLFQNTWTLNPGYYKDVDELAYFMSTDLASFINAISNTHETVKTTFTFDEKKRMMFNIVYVQIKQPMKIVVVFNKELLYRLAEIDLIAGMRLIYVYCDMVCHSLVGDTKAPLLRVLAARGTRGDVISSTFIKPYYIPIAKDDFDSIEININNEFGLPMPFTGGKSLVVLHFRRNGSVLRNLAV